MFCLLRVDLDVLEVFVCGILFSRLEKPGFEGGSICRQPAELTRHSRDNLGRRSCGWNRGTCIFKCL